MNQQLKGGEALSYQRGKGCGEDFNNFPFIAREPKVKIKSNLRRLKVYYKLGMSNKVPVILLQGEWIRNLGFNVHDKIVVSGENGRLEVKLVE